MPSVEFDPKNKVDDKDTFPKLKLEMGEYARILCVEKTPHFEYVHRLTKPRVVGGKPEYRTVKNKDGTSYQALENDFISQPFCLGDIGIIQDKGLDITNCPICAASVESEWVKPPERRFAMNIFKYMLVPHSFTVTEPFGGQVIAWVFGEKVFNRLADLSTEWGGLQNNDLNLGPITQPPVNFQKFDISVAADAAFRRAEASQKYLVAAYKAGRCEDLKKLCGRTVPIDFLKRDLEDIKAAHRTVRAYESGQVGVPEDEVNEGGPFANTGGVDLAAGLDQLLDDETPTPPAEGAVPVSEASIRDLVGEVVPPAQPAAQQPAEGSLDDLLSGDGEQRPVEPRPPSVPEPEAPKPAPATLDFEELLAQTE